MTVSSSTNRDDYAGNGSTTSFAVSFRFLENSHIKATLRDALSTETLQVETTDYTLTGAGGAGGGTLVMIVAPPSGTTLTIQRDVPATQETDYVENDEFPAESHEDALDKLTMLVQQQGEDSTRHIGFSDTVSDATGSAVELSQDATQRADTFIGFDALGNIVTKTASVAGLVDQGQQDKRYGPIFATKAAFQAANPISVDGVVVSLVAGMSAYIQGGAAAGDGGQKEVFIKASQAADELGDLTAANGTVGVLQGNGTAYLDQYGGTTAGVQAAFDSGATVVVANPGSTYNLTSDITISAAVEFVSDGAIFTGAGEFKADADLKHTGNGVFRNGTVSSVEHRNGVFDWFEGVWDENAAGRTTNILIKPNTANVARVIVARTTMSGGNFGILRNNSGGFKSLLSILKDNDIRSMKGDPIEWNATAAADDNLWIDGNYINDVDNTVPQPNWGIGIGIAGDGPFDDTYLDSRSVTNITISNNTIIGANECIHLEASGNIRIHNNHCIPDASKSSGAGLQDRGIILIGCYDIDVYDNNIECLNGAAAIEMQFGVAAAAFRSPCINYRINNNRCFDGFILSQTGGATITDENIIDITGNYVYNSRILHRGAVKMKFADNAAYLDGNAAIDIDYNRAFADGRINYNLLKSRSVRVVGNRGYTLDGLSDNSLIANAAADFASVEGNNFSYPAVDLSTGRTTSVNITSGSGTPAGAPIGREYQIGDLIRNIGQNKSYFCTVAGSENRATDTCSFISGNTFLKSTNYSWTSATVPDDRGHHFVGQQITISGAGPAAAALVTRVTRVGYVSGADIRIDIADAISTTGAGTITATATSTFVEV